MKYTVCPICNRHISNANYNKHINAHDKPPRYHKSIDHEGLNCKYCGKLCKHKNSLAQHEIRCSSNPDKLETPGNLLSHPSWNKGLTKETDVRVAKNAASVSKTLQQKVADGWKPFFATDDFWTEEMRTKRSEEKIQLFKEHPELHPNRRLASNKIMTYPEQVTADWLAKHNIHYTYQYKTAFNDKNRYVDFFLEDYALYIEVDGEYWHAKDKEKDLEKDLFALEAQGIKTLRISPKLGIEKQLEQYFNV
jgi:very-short-patch-repair endonuclease